MEGPLANAGGLREGEGGLGEGKWGEGESAPVQMPATQVALIPSVVMQLLALALLHCVTPTPQKVAVEPASMHVPLVPHGRRLQV